MTDFEKTMRKINLIKLMCSYFEQYIKTVFILTYRHGGKKYKPKKPVRNTIFIFRFIQKEQ